MRAGRTGIRGHERDLFFEQLARIFVERFRVERFDRARRCASLFI